MIRGRGVTLGGGASAPKSKKLETLEEGALVSVCENGVPTHFYLAKKDYEAGLNGGGRYLLVRKNLHSNVQWHTSNMDSYASSNIDAWLNGDYKNSLSSAVRQAIGETSFNYTVSFSNKTVTTLKRAVFIPSVTEFGHYYGGANEEGSALPIASMIQVGYLNGTATQQWTRSPYILAANYACQILANGTADAHPVTRAYGTRPCFTLPSTTEIAGEPNADGSYSLLCEMVADVYGIARDITSSSPEWARTDAAMNFTATASVGTAAGKSDFDNIYPWSEIKRETLSTGDVMVRIPKFYYGRYRVGNIERIQISGRNDVGLQLHPAFYHAGKEQDCIYVGAYKTSVDTSLSTWIASSLSGKAPMTGAAKSSFRTWTRAKGAGWSMIDISTISAIQMLYLVEFANNNSQAMIGRGYVDSNTATIKTGTCDTVIGLTGRPTGTDGKTDIVYRGVEGIWGNVWEFVDGVSSASAAGFYVCNNPEHYGDDSSYNYTKLSYAVSSKWSNAYIATVGLDTGENPHAMLPATNGGSDSTYYCDATWTNSSGWRIYLHGGDMASGSSCGLFCCYLDVASSGYNTTMGGRLIYIPQ